MANALEVARVAVLEVLGDVDALLGPLLRGFSEQLSAWEVNHAPGACVKTCSFGLEARLQSQAAPTRYRCWCSVRKRPGSFKGRCHVIFTSETFPRRNCVQRALQSSQRRSSGIVYRNGGCWHGDASCASLKLRQLQFKLQGHAPPPPDYLN